MKHNFKTITLKEVKMGDKEQISQEKHELVYVLRKYGKSGRAENVEKLATILNKFKTGRKDVSRTKFYEYLSKNAAFAKIK